MLYKPKFCCNCGEPIDRIEWTLLTSRRFCDACSVENKKYDVLPRGVVVFGVLAATFGLGSVWTSSTSSGSSGPMPADAAPVGVRTAQKAPLPPRSTIQVSEPVDPLANGSAEKGGITAADTSPRPSPDVASRQTTYYCGALTKKGTPCSRKVKAAGMRCFQHEGKPAASGDN